MDSEFSITDLDNHLNISGALQIYQVLSLLLIYVAVSFKSPPPQRPTFSHIVLLIACSHPLVSHYSSVGCQYNFAITSELLCKLSI